MCKVGDVVLRRVVASTDGSLIHFVCLGFGTLKGRKIVFTADDFSIRAGHADGALMDKTVS